MRASKRSKRCKNCKTLAAKVITYLIAAQADFMRLRGRKDIKKPALGLVFVCITTKNLFLDVREAVAEFLNAAAHIVDRFLCAGVKRVRGARCIEFEKWQFTAIFHFDRFFGVSA